MHKLYDDELIIERNIRQTSGAALSIEPTFVVQIFCAKYIHTQQSTAHTKKKEPTPEFDGVFVFHTAKSLHHPPSSTP